LRRESGDKEKDKDKVEEERLVRETRPEVLKLWGAPPEGAQLVLCGGRVGCTRDIFLLNEMWIQSKIHILVGTLLG
jgi:hypothetical protein